MSFNCISVEEKSQAPLCEAICIARHSAERGRACFLSGSPAVRLTPDLTFDARLLRQQQINLRLLNRQLGDRRSLLRAL